MNAFEKRKISFNIKENIWLFKSLKLNFKINLKLIIFYFILIIIIMFFSCILVLGGGGTRNGVKSSTIAPSEYIMYDDWHKNGEYEFKDNVALSTVFKYLTFGYVSIIINILLVCSLSKRNISKQIDSGSIYFWLIKPMSRKKLIFSKILFIYFVVLAFWFFNFICSSLIMTKIQNDKVNIGLAFLHMLNNLLFLIFISTIIIFLNIYLIQYSDWFNIIIGIFIIYFIIMCACDDVLKLKFIKFMNIKNLIPDVINFDGRGGSVYKKISTSIDGYSSKEYMLIYSHIKFNVWHLLIGYVFLLAPIFFWNKLIIYKFIKMEFNI